MKVCSNPDCPFAGQPQPFESFYRHKKHGYQYWCKTCMRAYNNTEKAKAKRREVSLAYSHTEHGKVKREAYRKSERGQQRLKIGLAKYSKSEKGRARDRRLRQQYPERIAARNAVNMAKYHKQIPPASHLPCASCGKPADHYHHYLGYAPEHWLDVIPLCLVCHQEEHS